ncbi:hypothetical protein C8J56DRAFT_1162372 [Mycena floridula]|nr:hypothetical protein C8J56DRAFT_1162372 [Mycena floridula]
MRPTYIFAGLLAVALPAAAQHRCELRSKPRCNRALCQSVVNCDFKTSSKSVCGWISKATNTAVLQPIECNRCQCTTIDTASMASAKKRHYGREEDEKRKAEQEKWDKEYVQSSHPGVYPVVVNSRHRRALRGCLVSLSGPEIKLFCIQVAANPLFSNTLIYSL